MHTSVNEIERAIDDFGLTETIGKAQQSTSQLFDGAAVILVFEADDAEDEPHLLFRVRVNRDATPQEVFERRSRWHDAMLDLLEEKIRYIRLVVDYR